MNDINYVLVVDDNYENLRVVGNILKEENFRIAMATSGKSAIEILKTNKIDLILLDIMMPEMDGFEVCRVLKEDFRTKDIPVIFLTVRTETEDILKSFQMGGVDFINKPFRREELIARVYNHVKLKTSREVLVNKELAAIKSRDHYMRTLYRLSKILSSKKSR
jgi:PleD family two-component response regulator